MIERMRALLKEMDICVLATAHEGRPHCSRRVYVTDAEGRRIYMITQRRTRKYQYLQKNPQASLLVDNRCQEKRMDRGKVKALTVYGVFEPCSDYLGKVLCFSLLEDISTRTSEGEPP